MPEDHEQPEDMVETPKVAKEAARTLEDAANSHNSLEGYAAINGLHGDDDMARIADEMAEDESDDQREGTIKGR